MNKYIRFPKINKVLLKSGAQLYLLKNKNLKLCKVSLSIFVGSIYEPIKLSGISHLTEHMLFKANKKLGNFDDIYHKLESLPGDINAQTGVYSTEISYEFPSFCWKQGIINIIDLVFYPVFKNLDKEKSIIKEEIKSELNKKYQLVDLVEITHKLLWPKQSLGIPIFGTLTSLSKINKNDLIKHFNNYYHPKNMIISIVGNFDKSNIINLLNDIIIASNGKNLKPVKKEQKIKPQKNIHWVETNDSQLVINWSFWLDNLNTKEIFVLDIINQILDDGISSYLFKIIREKQGLVYDISSNLFSYDQQAYLSIKTSISHKNKYKLIKLISDLVLDLSNNGFSQSNIDLIKKRKLSYFYSLSDSLYLYMDLVVYESIFPNLSMKNYIKFIKNIDLSAVNKMLTILFNKNDSILVISGNGDDVDKKKILKYFNQWLPNQNLKW